MECCHIFLGPFQAYLKIIFDQALSPKPFAIKTHFFVFDSNLLLSFNTFLKEMYYIFPNETQPQNCVALL